MSVSLASPDGRVVGGGVAGLLVAASPVQVINVLPSFSTLHAQSFLLFTLNLPKPQNFKQRYRMFLLFKLVSPLL